MGNFIVIVILLLVIGAAIRHIIRTKKSGAGCMGCPSAGCCTSGKCIGEKGKKKREE